ncbi:hypothetical protein [Pseudokineococcus lusitanus]|uniref:hypothetical protein n=1 Tax=Pseudokineococcus lusitanus TaxID=763993 RepID=UPI000F4888AF|nr:hypothetical protein [Pseudokineococcus lusitanus]
MYPVVVRRQLNRWAGFLSGFGVLAFTVATDRFFAWRSSPDTPPPTSLQVLLDYGWVFPALSVVLLTLGARPRIDVWPDHLIVRNLISDTTVPRQAYLGLSEGFPGWMRLRTTGGQVYAWALGVDDHEEVPAERDLLTEAFLNHPTASLTTRAARRVSRRPRSPEWYEMVLWMTWIAYIAAALLP